MKELTVGEVLDFFRNLNFKDKIEVLSQITLELKRGVEEPIERKHVEGKPNEDELIDGLFGMWKSEEDLTEETIIDRTVSERGIHLD